jgi:hypothetical protein
VSEVSWTTFREVTSLTTEDEILPGWDCFNHDSAMIPSGDVVVNVRIIPFVSVKVKDNDVIELVFRVPTTVGVDFSAY